MTKLHLTVAIIVGSISLVYLSIAKDTFDGTKAYTDCVMHTLDLDSKTYVRESTAAEITEFLSHSNEHIQSLAIMDTAANLSVKNTPDYVATKGLKKCLEDLDKKLKRKLEIQVGW